MEQITKKDIVNQIHEKLAMKKKDAAPAVDMVFSVIAENLAKGNVVDIHGFGKFVVMERSERQGVNPASGKAMTIKASKNVKFRCSDTLKRSVNE